MTNVEFKPNCRESSVLYLTGVIQAVCYLLTLVLVVSEFMFVDAHHNSLCELSTHHVSVESLLAPVLVNAHALPQPCLHRNAVFSPEVYCNAH